MNGQPTVSVILPVFNEETYLGDCLRSVAAQSYPAIVEVIIADGGSSDQTREIARSFEKVRIVDNPRRSRPAGLNAAIGEACGDVIVRVDARTRLAPTYVESCVAALYSSGAAIVGGPLRFLATTAKERAIAAAMQSRLGAGPAPHRRAFAEGRFVDTVYLGAFRSETITRLGGYDEWSGGNEDAELAYRAQQVGGVFLDPSIESVYVMRGELRALSRQFYRWGRNRARTLRKHPRALSPRQLAVPLLLAGLLSPWRREVAAAYAVMVIGRGALEATRDPRAAPSFLVSLPVMHASWGAGFIRGIFSPRQGPSGAGR